MTPETWSALGALVERYGLPLAMLGGLLWLLLSGRFVLGSQLKTMTDLYERERADRIAAEAMVSGFASANADVAEAVADLSRAVIGPEEPYDERLGTQKRIGSKGNTERPGSASRGGARHGSE